ncbi:hypothetical protein [Streptomyces scopuliridis]|uniref:hypothetical protein n=1 Tax=Streptomyces scopuliridis TaxID=452529 RepID=UPI003678BDB8
MSTAPSGWSLRALAQEARVLPKVARDAAEEGVIDAHHTVETDIVLVRLYGALKRLVWPEERRPANKDQGLRVWEAITIETARAALPDEVQDDTGLFVHQAGCELVSGPGPHCLALFKLADQPFYYAPLGRWFNELPSRRLVADESKEKAGV